jgi:hypothetical protein
VKKNCIDGTTQKKDGGQDKRRGTVGVAEPVCTGVWRGTLTSGTGAVTLPNNLLPLIFVQCRFKNGIAIDFVGHYFFKLKIGLFF